MRYGIYLEIAGLTGWAPQWRSGRAVEVEDATFLDEGAGLVPIED